MIQPSEATRPWLTTLAGFHRAARGPSDKWPYDARKENWLECMQGKSVLITGATAGIGLATAKLMAQGGAHLVLACRDMEKAGRVKQILVAQTPSSNIRLYRLDLASFSSIRSCASQILSDDTAIHALINNAGTLPLQYGQTEDGFETQIGVNFLGHFLFTNLLLDHLKRSAPASIVHLSSVVHHRGTIDFGSFRECQRNYQWGVAYAQSKLANVLFSVELARRLEGAGVTSNAIHPGIVSTQIARFMPKLIRPGLSLVGKSAESAALAIIRLVFNPDLAGVTGQYFSGNKLKRMSVRASDPKLARDLWAEAELLTFLN